MGEVVTSHFPAMGEGPFTDVHDPSADRSPYTRLRPKQGGKSVAPDSVQAHRGQSPVNAEVLGPLCRPNTTIAYSSDPLNTRNVRVVPSRAGVGDMWAKRMEGPVIG